MKFKDQQFLSSEQLTATEGKFDIFHYGALLHIFLSTKKSKDTRWYKLAHEEQMNYTQFFQFLSRLRGSR